MAKKTSETNQPEGSINRMPPQSVEAEQSVLGALLLDKDAIIKIADILYADDFYDDRHRLIYLAVLHLYDERSTIDILTLSNRLEESGTLEKIPASVVKTKICQKFVAKDLNNQIINSIIALILIKTIFLIKSVNLPLKKVNMAIKNPVIEYTIPNWRY